MANNPIELITASQSRIARNEAMRASIYFLAPALTAIALGALLPAIGATTWQRAGYVMSPEMMSIARIALIAIGFIAIVAAALRALLAHRSSNDFVGAAMRVDERAHGHEQVVTLATLSDPSGKEAERSPLFPVLWSNVLKILSAFDPDREFTIQLGDPIKESWIPTALVIAASIIAMAVFIRMPTPLEQTAIELKKLADKIDAAPESTPEDKQLAQKIKRVAIELARSDVTPEEKQKELEDLNAEVEKKQSEGADQATGMSNGKGSGAGTSAASAKGGSEGKGEGGQSQGQGKGAGKGEGKGSGGNQQNANGTKNRENKGAADSIELRNEIAKAQVQTEDLAANQAPNKPSPDAKTAQAPKPGNNPNQQGGSSKNPNEKGSAPMPVPQMGANTPNPMPNGQGPQPKKGGTGGDTKLGEFPAAANYQRFIKPGEKANGLNLTDARFVVFKIPSAPSSGDDGKTVIDTERPQARTAYTNAPLAPTSDTAPPDERQLVPPRYRDLIH